jgi:hypothetical protein
MLLIGIQNSENKIKIMSLKCKSIFLVVFDGILKANSEWQSYLTTKIVVHDNDAHFKSKKLAKQKID